MIMGIEFRFVMLEKFFRWKVLMVEKDANAFSAIELLA